MLGAGKRVSRGNLILSQNRLNEWFARNAGRHFVSLSCVQHRPDQRESGIVFSGFIAEIESVWFYVTAGHILSFVCSMPLSALGGTV